MLKKTAPLPHKKRARTESSRPTEDYSTQSSSTQDSSSSAQDSSTQDSGTSSDNAAKYAIGYNSEWERDYSWLQVVRNAEGTVTGMLCTLCKRHNTKNKYNQKAIWNETPCVCLRRDSLRRHSLSQQHKDAVDLEKHKKETQRSGGIRQAFKSQLALNKSARKTAMQCPYWLVKSEVPHTTNYNSLIKATEFMGCPQLKYLYHGENAKYSSQRTIQEFLKVIGEQIEQEILVNLLTSPLYSIMIDETTDVSVLKELVVYALYLTTGAKVCTSFLAIIDLPNGTAETVERYLTTYLESKNIPISRMVGFGTDGASVMTGKHNGVAAHLKHRQPILISVHCIAHRLALAAGQSDESVRTSLIHSSPPLSSCLTFTKIVQFE